jgi:hypothetical protein
VASLFGTNKKLEKFERKFLCFGIWQRPLGTYCKFPEEICKDVFQICEIKIFKIAIKLGTQKRNACRSLPEKKHDLPGRTL